MIKFFTLKNKKTGWYRHLNGGRDTDRPADAMRLNERECAEFQTAFAADYTLIPIEEAVKIPAPS